MRTTASVIFLALIAFCNLWSQTTVVSQISGTVRDVNGLPIAGAAVLMSETETGLTRSASTGEDGFYQVLNLPVGPYQLRVTKDAFEGYQQNGIVLQVNTNPEINVTLKLGSVTQTVEVHANAAMVETNSTAISTVMDNKRVEELPLNGRQETSLIQLAGAAQPFSPTNTLGAKNYPTEVAYSIEGSTGNSTFFLLDGGSDNDLFTNVSSPIPFPDAIEEFSVITGSLPARYGYHSGSVVNLVTKSGTNQFHGALFEYLRNGDFDARALLATARDSLKRNQFGGVIGGPIRRNKLFFFAGYQGTSTKSNPPQTIDFVPTQAMLNGDFTAITSPACNGGKQIHLGAPYVNNQLAVSQINPVALNVLKKIPLSTDPCGKLVFGIINNSTENQGVARVDYTLSDKHTMFVRYLVSDYENPDGSVPGNALTTQRPGLSYRDQNATIGDTYLFSPNTINSAHLTFMRNRTNRTPAPGEGVGTDYGINQYNPVPSQFIMTVSGAFSVSSTGGGLSDFDPTNGWFADDVDLVRGNHQIAFGGITYYNQFNSFNNQFTNGQWAFNGAITGLALADYMVGSPNTFTQGNNGFDYNRSNYYSLYVQDSWKMSSRLRVNYGIRWEPYLPEHYKGNPPPVEHFSMNNFVAGVHSKVFTNAPAGMLFTGDKGMPGAFSFVTPNWNQWSPRVGIVWDPDGKGRQTIRASFSLVHDYPEMYYANYVTNSPPWGGLVQLLSPAGGFSNPWLGYPGGNPFPQSLPPPASYVFPNFSTFTNISAGTRLKSTYTEYWNANYQRQLGDNFLMSISYLGNGIRHMWAAKNINPAVYIPGTCGTSACSTLANENIRRVLYLDNPATGAGAGYQGIFQTDDGANSSYNALLASIEHRFSHNYTFIANYTWSHCIDFQDTGGDLGAASPMLQNPYDLRSDLGDCGSDVRQMFNSLIIAEVPQFQQSALRKIVSGWRVSAISTAQTGLPANITTGTDTSLTGAYATAPPTDRPNLIGHAMGNATISNWFVRSAFVNNAPGTYGDLGRDALRQPGRWNIDAALERTFKIYEGQALEFRAEAFNVLNHGNFYTAVTTLNSSNFGHVTTAGPPRICEFALKYIF